jgi:uncharacterized membrane protein
VKPDQEDNVSDLIAIAYPDLATAQDVASNAAALTKSKELDLEDLVVVEHRPDGKIKLHQPSTAAAGAAGGALWGGLIGLIFLAPLLGAAIGAAAGAAGGAVTDLGIEDDFMRELGRSLPENGAAVFALVRQVTPDKVLPRISQYGGKVLQTSLSNDSEQRLQEALDAAAHA